MPMGMGYKGGHKPVKRKSTVSAGIAGTTNTKHGPKKPMKKPGKNTAHKGRYN